MSEQEHEGAPASTGSRRPAVARAFVLTATALALLLIGGAGGLLLGTAGSGQRASPAPSAVDIGFAQDMTLHHRQAVTMATLARARASDPAVRQLAFDIETNQRNQIGRMQGWLSLWDQPSLNPARPMGWMSGSGSGSGQHGSQHSGQRMPGMAGSAELRHFRSLRGAAFDVEFLQLMLRHHEGGSAMARYGAEHAAVPAVRRLAGNMLGSQAKESRIMRRMLSERDARPLPVR